MDQPLLRRLAAALAASVVSAMAVLVFAPAAAAEELPDRGVGSGSQTQQGVSVGVVPRGSTVIPEEPAAPAAPEPPATAPTTLPKTGPKETLAVIGIATLQLGLIMAVRSARRVPRVA